MSSSNPTPEPNPRALFTRYASLVASVVALGVGAFAWGVDAPSPVGWLAVAAFLFATPDALRRVGELELTRRHELIAAPVICGASLLAVFLGSFWPMLSGKMPVTQDHAHHYFQTRILLDELLADGHIFGWTDRISTGIPFGDVYGTGVYFITAAGHLLSFGLLGEQTSYSLGLLVVWGLSIAAVALWARRLDRASWFTPFFAGTAYLLDVGGDREGGWLYGMFHAVWPQQLATALWLLGMLALFELARKPTTRRLALSVLTVGAAFWAHPMNALNYLFIAPLLIGIHLLPDTSTDQPRGEAGERGIWIIFALGLAGLIGLGWVSHMLGASGSVKQFQASWLTLEQMGRALWQAKLFDHHLAIVGVLGLVGLGATWVKKERFAWFTLAAFFFFALFGSAELVLLTDAGLHPDNPLFMYRRLTLSLKPLWYALAGVGAGVVFEALWARARRAANTTPARARRAVLAVLAAPLLWNLATQVSVIAPGPVARPLTADQANLSEDFARVTELLNQRADALGTDHIKRVAYTHKRGESSDHALIPIADAGFGYLPSRPPPCQAYKTLNTTRANPSERARRLWDILGVSALITHSPREIEGATLLAKLDHFHVYELEPRSPWPVELEGPGALTVTSWGSQYREIKLTGTDETSRLVLGWPPYKKWTASLDGAPRSLTPYRVEGMTLASISGLRDGVLVLDYEDGRFERITITLAALVILLCLVLLIRRDAPLGRPAPALVSVWISRAALAGAGALAAGFVAVLVYRGERGVQSEWGKGHPGHEVSRVLHHKTPSAFTYTPESYCVRTFTRDPRPGCDEWDLEPRLATAPTRGKKLPACMKFGVPGGGQTTLTFSIAPDEELVVGRVHTGRSTKVEVVAGPDDSVLRAGGKAFTLETSGARELTFTVTAKQRSTASVCLELVTLSRVAR